MAAPPRRLVALVVATTLLASACGAAGIGAEDTGGRTSPDVDLIATNSSGDPFSRDGGTTSSDEGVIIDPTGLSGFSQRIQSAVSNWPTDFSRRTVELDEFLLGLARVDPRDGIPPIDNPKFEPIATAAWLGDREPGALVQFNGEVRFYPLSIMTRHEIVNDRFGDVPVAVTYCPLCNSVVAFDARVDGNALRFGVSGLLRNSDLVMWDSATTSLWQQITGEGLVGEFAGTELVQIPASIVSYAEVRDTHPDALSLSTDTGFGSSYGRNSYVSYSSSIRPFLFDGELDDRFPALSRVVGVTVDGESKAYPFELLADKPAVNDVVGGQPIAVLWGGETADALDARQIAESRSIGTAVAYDPVIDGQRLTFTPDGSGGFVDTETRSSWNHLGIAVSGTLAGAQLEPVVHRNEFWFAWSAFFGDAPVYE